MPAAATKKRILLLIEDPLLANFFRDKLDACGFDAVMAGATYDGVNSFREQKADLVLVDPVFSTLDGPEAIHAIRELSAQTPISVLSNLPRTLLRSVEKEGATNIITASGSPLEPVLKEIESLFGVDVGGYDLRIQNPDEFWLASCLNSAPESLKAMRLAAYTFAKTRSNQTLLHDLFHETHHLAERLAVVGLTALQKMAVSIEMLVYDLYEMPEQLNDSTVRTAVQAVDFLGTLLDPAIMVRLTDPTGSAILAVDDEPDALRTIASAMELVGLQTSGAPTAEEALGLLNDVDFKLVFVDIGLPGVNGFDLCKKAREIPRHQKTPMVFLTGMATFQNRALSTLSGGNDFIGKPFNLFELGTKALGWLFKGQIGL
jgi:DNA-binding response OmpR family regulator